MQNYFCALTSKVWVVLFFYCFHVLDIFCYYLWGTPIHFKPEYIYNIWICDNVRKGTLYCLQNNCLPLHHLVKDVSEIWKPGRAIINLDTKFHWLPIQNGGIVREHLIKNYFEGKCPFSKIRWRELAKKDQVRCCTETWTNK